MHQLSIIRQSERVKGDWWMSSPISPDYPPKPPLPATPPPPPSIPTPTPAPCLCYPTFTRLLSLRSTTPAGHVTRAVQEPLQDGGDSGSTTTEYKH